MKQAIKETISKYSTLIKRGLGIAAIFWMLVAIQTYNNYLTIIENTTVVEKQAQKVLDEISYFNHFQLKYLHSSHAERFLAHENNILTPGEAIITFQEVAPALELTGNITPSTEESTPRKERKKFFDKKLN